MRFHPTHRGALRCAAKQNAARSRAPRGRSSGHSHLDVSVRPGPGRLLRRFEVYTRSR